MLKAIFISDARDLLTGARCELPSGEMVEVKGRRTPLFALCRELDKRGYGDCRIEIFTPKGTPSMRGKVTALAGLTVKERDKDGLRLEKYQPFPPPCPLTDAREPLSGVRAPENEETRLASHRAGAKAA